MTATIVIVLLSFPALWGLLYLLNPLIAKMNGDNTIGKAPIWNQFLSVLYYWVPFWILISIIRYGFGYWIGQLWDLPNHWLWMGLIVVIVSLIILAVEYIRGKIKL